MVQAPKNVFETVVFVVFLKMFGLKWKNTLSKLFSCLYNREYWLNWIISTVKLLVKLDRLPV
jgi:hypothetical protein